MSFLHSWMVLWFLPLAAIPIVLHLLTLHRLKTVELPTFRFLFDSYVQQRRRMRFLEALLAMLRTLFLLFLIFMVCRPVVRHWGRLFGPGSGSGGREVVLLVDCSASMNANTAGKSAFDRAKAAARSLVERLGRDDKLTLVRVGARPEEVFSRFNTDTQGILDAIDNLQPTSSRANLFATFLQLFGSEAGRRGNPAVYLFTDCQVSGWKEARDQGLERLLPAGTPFTLVNVGSPSTLPNRAVVGDAPARNRAIAGLPFVLRPRVVNYSKTEPAELTLSVFLDGKEVARTPLTLKPGESAVRPVVYTPTEPGLRRGRFEISAKNPDRFPDDDNFLFTLTVEPRIKVVLVNGHPNADPQLDEARYLATALASRAEVAREKKPGDLAKTHEIARSLEVQELAEPALTADTLKGASVVVLANCGALSDVQFGWLRTFVRNGGGLLIFPGDRVTPVAYNTRFFPVPGPLGEVLTGAQLTAPQGDPEKVETFEQLASLDFAHPALAVFDNPDPDARHFKTVRVYKRFGLVLPKKSGKARPSTWPLATFNSGAPALVESRLGDGTVVLAAFPAHPRWGNLPLKPDFVPLMLRLVSHAEHRPEAEAPPVVVADGTAEVSVSATWQGADVAVKDPAGRLTPVPLERAGARLLGAFERTGRRGYYAVEVRGRADQGKVATLAFAVNLAPEESDFTFLDEEGVRALLPKGVPLTFVDASAQAQELHGTIGKERELWPILIWVLFGIIGVEFLLATLGGKRPGADEGPGLGERVLSVGTGAWVGRMTGAPGKES